MSGHYAAQVETPEHLYRDIAARVSWDPDPDSKATEREFRSTVNEAYQAGRADHHDAMSDAYKLGHAIGTVELDRVRGVLTAAIHRNGEGTISDVDGHYIANVLAGNE